MRKTKLILLFLILGCFSAMAQIKISGIVKDESGEPLIGVNVVVKGTTNGTLTDISGKYHLNVKKKDLVVFSYIGYTQQQVTVLNQNTINIVLKEEAGKLDEVVVVGYGTSKRKDFTGSLSSVNNDILLETNRTSAASALQGQIAGVDVTKSNNKPGAGLNIMIRGQNTISGLKGSDDKTNINDINPPLYVVDGMFVDGIDDISPNDIERIDVLKDASSTAIYGSRGANGVVLVTTKKGSKGRSKVEYNASFTLGEAMNLPTFTNSDEYVQYRVDREKGVHYSDPSYTPDVKSLLGEKAYNNYLNKKSVDWADEVLKKSFSQNHSARVSGSGEGLVYSFGIGYTNEGGIIDGDDFKRYNLSASADRQINKVLKAGTSLYAAYSETGRAGTETFRSIYRLNPLSDVYNEDGSYKLYPDDQLSSITNPILEAKNDISQTKTLHTFGSAYLEVKPLSWIKFTTTLTPDITFTRFGEYRGKDTKTAKGNQTSTRAFYNSSNCQKYTWDNIIYAEKAIDKHSVNLTLGSSWYHKVYDYGNIEVRNIPADSYLWYNLGSALDKRSITSDYTKEQLMSYFARANYDYMGKYLLTFTGRYDGSSKLAEGHQWKFFPSAAVGWRVTEENFMKKYEAINNLKLRLSYGQSGNNGISPYSSAQNIYNSSYIFDNNIVTSAGIGGFANKTLSWEVTKELNLGLDYGLFNNRINGTIDIYNRNTDDILMSRVMSQMNGSGSVIDNVGKVQNKGVELTLNTVNIKIKDFTWSTSINFTKNVNKIKELNDGQTEDKNNGWFVGKSIGSIYTYKYLGLWQESEAEEAAKYGLWPGCIKAEDKDHNYTYNNDDKEIIGNVFPKWTGSITNSFKYKNVDLSFFVYTRQGQISYSQFHRSYSMFDNVRFNVLKLNYWTPENLTGTWARPGASRSNEDLLYYQKTSFVKVGYINLGYNFPNSLIKNAGLSKARVYVSCQNPFVFTDYKGWDPETASENTWTQYPMTRSFSVGLNVAF